MREVYICGVPGAVLHVHLGAVVGVSHTRKSAGDGDGAEDQPTAELLCERDEARVELERLREEFDAWKQTARAEIADHLAHRLAAERLHRAVLDGAALSGAVVQGVLDFAHRVAAGEAESFSTCDLSTPTTGPLSVTIRKAVGVTPAQQLERLAVLAAVLDGQVSDVGGALCLGMDGEAFLDLKARAIRNGRNAWRRWRDTGVVRTTPGAAARTAAQGGTQAEAGFSTNGAPKKGA